MPSIQNFIDEKSPLQSQQHYYTTSSLLLDIQNKSRYRTPPLLSSSMRARSSPKLIHGNSPLLQSWEAEYNLDDQVSSSSQSEDAKNDDSTLVSPSSKFLQEQLRNAVRAVEELQEAVEKQRSKRNSMSNAIIKYKDGAATTIQEDIAATFGNEKEKVNCTDRHSSDCRDVKAAIGLGLDIPSGKILKRTSTSIEFLTSIHHEAEFPMMAPKLNRRNISLKENIACNATLSAVATPSKTFVSASNSASTFVSDRTSTPLQDYSPNTFSSAPFTPTIEAGSNSVTIVSSPLITRTTDSAMGPIETNHAGNADNTKSSSSFQYSSSHGVSNTLIAVASVSAAGSLLILAAILYTLFKLRRRKQQHRQKMSAVLSKVSSHPTTKDTEADHSIDGAAEKRVSNYYHDRFFIIGASKKTSKENMKYKTEAKSTPDKIRPPPKELEMISPWLNYDMPGHPFANVSSVCSPSDRYSPDLAYTGIVGHETSKDQSFNWNFPKLSVPPAAARAMGTSHYVKKRMTLPRKSVTSPLLSSFNIDATESKAAPSLAFNSPSMQASMETNNVAQDLRTSTSSEVIDPEIDHIRRSFCIPKEDSGAIQPSLGWIQSARSMLGSREAVKVSRDVAIPDTKASRARSYHSSRRHSDASIFGIDLDSSSEAHQQLQRDLGLPSLSIANSSIIDARESSFLSRKNSKTRWTRSMMPLRILSSESEDSHSYRDQKKTRKSRRLSHSEALQQQQQQQYEAGAKINVVEKFLPRVPHFEVEDSKECKVIVVDRALHRFNWTQDVTDTEDESREGYEAEHETETEFESELPHSSAPSSTDEKSKINRAHSGDGSTPLITLTTSEEEGRFERRISLSSSTVHGMSDQEQYNEITTAGVASLDLETHANMLDSNTSDDEVEENEEEDEDVTVICHGLNSRESISDNSTSRSERPDEVNCLLSDDFPTIPEWVPIQGALRNTTS